MYISKTKQNKTKQKQKQTKNKQKTNKQKQKQKQKQNKNKTNKKKTIGKVHFGWRLKSLTKEYALALKMYIPRKLKVLLVLSYLFQHKETGIFRYRFQYS